MKGKITRRDFLNGTQVAIGASLLSPWTEVFGAEASEFQLGGRLLPARKDGSSRKPRRFMGDHAFAGNRNDVAESCARGRIRSRGRWWWYQRPCRGTFLPQGASRGPGPHPRQPRRFRRPRQAQRVPSERRDAHRLRRHGVHRHPRRRTRTFPKRCSKTSASTSSAFMSTTTRSSTTRSIFLTRSPTTARPTGSASWSAATALDRGRSSRPKRR